MALSAVHHIAVQVRDLTVARGFYEGVLGLLVVRELPHAVWVQCGQTVVMLERCTGQPRRDVADWKSERLGPHLIAFTIDVAEREAWRSKLSMAGFPVVHESDFTVYVRDPDGTRVGLSHYPTKRLM